MNQQGWIGVDLDGTLAHFTKWTDLLVIGEPVWPMVERVQQWLREGKRVKIFTARAHPPYVSTIKPDIGFDDVVDAIQNWCQEHIGECLEVTHSKDLHMIELWDDRCVQVQPNTGEPVTFWESRV